MQITIAVPARLGELLAQHKSVTLTRSAAVELVGVAALTRESIHALRTLGADSKSSCRSKRAGFGCLWRLHRQPQAPPE
jgi:hypothetical protein